jgi:acetylornithine deacetylase/succinyl-diaminopimelate desuccinylase-like protein
MRPNDTGIHNGADDNASGTAAVLVAAKKLHDMMKTVKDHRRIVVALFSAEEVGLGGSGYFVENLPIPLASIKAMVNRHGRRDEGRQARRARRGVGAGVEAAARFAERRDEARHHVERRRLRSVGPDLVLCETDPGAALLHRLARALSHARR